MFLFYLSTAVIASVALAADFILRYLEGMRSFGIEKTFPRIKGKTIPIEQLFPENLTYLLAYLAVFGWTGLALTLAAIPWYLSVIIALCAACLANFLLSYFFVSRILRIRGRSAAPKDDLTEGEAVCTEEIAEDGYGKIRITLPNGVQTEKNAVSVHGTAVAAGETVIVLGSEDELCFVVRESEIHKEIE